MPIASRRALLALVPVLAIAACAPKAGGPYALTRFSSERAISVNITAQGGDPALLNL